MRIKLLIAFLLIGFIGNSQIRYLHPWYHFENKVTVNDLFADSVFYAPLIDTGTFTPSRIGALTVHSDGLAYIWDGSAWVILAGSADGNNYPSSISFSGGILTVPRNGLSDLTATIDGRYLKITDTTGLWLNQGTANNLYAEIEHEHTASDISDLTSYVRNLFSGGTGITYNDSTGVISWNGSASGITSLNGLSGTTQTFSGVGVNISSVGTDHEFTVDSLLYTTRLRTIHVADSLQAINNAALALKLNISDTAAITKDWAKVTGKPDFMLRAEILDSLSDHWAAIEAGGGGGGGGTWGSITGTLSDQTDLQTALDLKLNISDTTSKTWDWGDITGEPTFLTTETDPIYVADSSTKTWDWARVTGKPTLLSNPMTTTGDIIYSSDGSGTPARLAAGTDGYVLKLASGVPTWAAESGGGSGWGLTGNAGTTAGTNYLGTSDAVDLVFKANASEVARFVSSSGNFGIGKTPYSSTRLTVKGSGGTNTTYSMYAENSTNTNIFYVGNGGRVGVGALASPSLESFVSHGYSTFNNYVQVKSYGEFIEQTTPGTATSGYSRLFVKSDGKFYGVDDSGVETQLSNASGSGARDKSWDIEYPSASENIFLFHTKVAITITDLFDVAVGGTPSVTYQIHHATTRNSGSPNNLFSSSRTATSESGATTTTFNDATIPAGSYVWLTTSASSDITNLNLSIVTTND